MQRNVFFEIKDFKDLQFSCYNCAVSNKQNMTTMNMKFIEQFVLLWDALKLVTGGNLILIPNIGI